MPPARPYHPHGTSYLANSALDIRQPTHHLSIPHSRSSKFLQVKCSQHARLGHATRGSAASVPQSSPVQSSPVTDHRPQTSCPMNKLPDAQCTARPVSRSPKQILAAMVSPFHQLDDALRRTGRWPLLRLPFYFLLARRRADHGDPLRINQMVWRRL